MSAIPVRVTRKLINYALTENKTQCAIAQALRDASDTFMHPYVDQKHIKVTDRVTGKRYTFNTPQKLANWVTQFDRDPTKTNPISFSLDLTQADSVRDIKRNSVEQSIKKSQAAKNKKVKKATPAVSYTMRPKT